MVGEQGLQISPTCTIAELEALEAPPEWTAAPLIRQCCHAFLASFKVWNTATVGGNICMSLPAGPMMTEIITVNVKPGMEEAYRDWVERIRQVEARFPGYQGLQLQPPIPGLQDDWVSLLRFDTAEHLNAWLESDARRAALQEVEPFIDRREQQIATSFSVGSPSVTFPTRCRPTGSSP